MSAEPVPDFSDPKARMAHARSFQKGPIPQRKPAPDELTEKAVYDETLRQVWDIIVDPATKPDMRARYHFAILRWQGKLDAVDDKSLDELKKLLGKKAS